MAQPPPLLSETTADEVDRDISVVGVHRSSGVAGRVPRRIVITVVEGALQSIMAMK